MGRTKGKFTFKIFFSYVVLAGLALIAGFFILSEIRTYISSDTADENDSKLLKTGTLLTKIYEAESLSKLALQTKTKKNFNAYATKIDSVLVDVDSLKLLSNSDYQKSLLDSLQVLLRKKVANSNELRNLKVKKDANNAMDSALKKFSSLEASLGKITPEGLAPNIDELSPDAQRVIRRLADYYNENVPKDREGTNGAEKIDSIINVSKALLNEVKLKEIRTQRSLDRKEMQVNRNDLELSQQMRSIISAFEREVIVNTYNDNIKKQAALRRSIRLAVFAVLLGFVITGIFTLLISRDFWKVQKYREKLEAEKKYSESILKSREQLIATVSHDLRTPLNTISGYSELMENTGLTEKQVTYLTQVKSASGYVNDLVNDLLDFSKLEAGQLKVEKLPFILSDLIRETANGIAEIYAKEPIELSFNISERLDTTLIGDPFRIRQILSNLIGNAYKFTAKGFIKIDARIKAIQENVAVVLIRVTDSGIGIKKEKQEHIFKEFAQAEDITEKKYGGYGLGLTISKKLAELLKGTLFLESQENKGSSFTVILPIALAKKQMGLAKKEIPQTVDVNLSMLIIDDDTAMLQLLREVVGNAGITAYTYSDFSVVEKDADISYDLVLTDIEMPKITGFEVLKKLRSGEYQHYINQPVLAMTGRRDIEQGIFLEAGFHRMLSKPFTKITLLTIIQSLFPTKCISKTDENISNSSQNNSNLFDITLISSFLNGNENAIAEILTTFLADTSHNMKELGKGFTDGDYKILNQISHRMLPMFRQLRANEIIPILEQLEGMESIEPNSIKTEFASLKNKVKALELALQKYMATNLDYSN